MKIDKYVFKRQEIKYKLTSAQYATVLQEVNKHLSVDEYGETTIQSLYYDTDTWLLIRNSIEKQFIKKRYAQEAMVLQRLIKKSFSSSKRNAKRSFLSAVSA